MQIENTVHTQQPNQARAGFSSRAADGRGAGFARELDAERIRLGTISRENPTVSHLLVNHPEYGDDCWDIVHSKVNADKPYTRIPAETPIYMDPESGELSWPSGEAASAYARNAWAPETEGAERRDSTAREPQGMNGDVGQAIEGAIAGAADSHNISPALIQAVIRAESNFEPGAVSRAGAQGLMQLMPSTAEELGVLDSFDIGQNIDGGTRYLKQMLTIFDGDLEKALAAYNAGPNTIRSHGGEIPYPETRAYVDRVLAYLKQPGPLYADLSEL